MYEIIKILSQKKPLSSKHIFRFLEEVKSGKVHPANQAAVLSAMKVKGITPKELAAFVRVLWSRSRQSYSLPNALSFFGPKEAAICISALGIPVVRHGDTVDHLGSEKRKKVFEQVGLGFLETEKLFPDYQNFSRVRKTLEMETIFDLAEPLLNPAGAKTLLAIVRSRENVKLLSQAARLLKLQHVKILMEDDVVHHSAQALKLFRVTSNLKKAYQKAHQCQSGGTANQHFLTYKRAASTPEILLDIVSHKKLEVEKRKKKMPLKRLLKKLPSSDRDFKNCLLQKGLTLIAEIRKVSPFERAIMKVPFSVERIAKKYEQSGARAISVATDKKYFQGSLHHLRKVREATKDIPLLCRDFMVDEYQIYEARYFGADAILLLASILTKDQIQRFLEIALQLKMDVVCEIHTEEDLRILSETNAEIISINNRHPGSFNISLSTTSKLVRKISAEKIILSEGGISKKADVKKLPKRIQGIFVGSSFLQKKNIQKKIEDLIGKPKPMLKLSGIRSLDQALLCGKMDVDMIGLNFIPTNEHRISYQLGEQITQRIHRQYPSLKVVGIFQNQDLLEVNTAAEKLNLDFIQLSGDEPISFVKKCERPVMKRILVTREGSLKKALRYVSHTKFILFEPAKNFDQKLLKKFHHRFFLSVSGQLENIRLMLQSFDPFGIDIVNGIETDVSADRKKMQKLVHQISRL